MKLVIAEKKSVAESISAVLNAKKREDGFFIGSDGYIVTWCVGHLVELAQADAYDEKFSKWKYADLPIIPREWKYTVPKDKRKQLKVISDLMKRPDVDTIVCSTDAGREGELIFRLVYEHCRCKKPIQRLWISSMEAKAISDGFANLRPGAEYERLYKAALCRSQADWIVGINGTRLFSTLYNSTLNIGRVMTPTLALIVEREKEISAFVKQPFYTVEIDCDGFTLSGDRQKDKQTAENIRAACDGKTAVIASVASQDKSIQPPKLYDLTSLQREANRLFGYTSQQTLDCAQNLYEKRLATYPRTDSRYLTEDMAGTLAALVEVVTETVPFVKGINTISTKRVIDNSKVTDHHAIIPTLTIAETDLSVLPSSERDILFMLAARLICAVDENHLYTETTVTAVCENYSFSAKGKTVRKAGWKAVEQAFKAMYKNKSSEDEEKDDVLPELSEGQAFENVHAGLREGFTSPPKHFTEDTLLSAMECAGDFSDIPDAERKGLGTSATRAGIIEKLIKKEFVKREAAKKVKNLIPTEKAVNLITVLPEVIKSPELTAQWEGQLKQIEKGEITDSAFMAGIAELTDGLVKSNTAAAPEFAALFPSSKAKGEATGVCPRCGGSVYERQKGFFCENGACKFALWKNNKFFAVKKKEITAKIAADLLKDGRVYMTGLFSEKTSKEYNATIILKDTGEYVNFDMEFEKNKR